MRAYNSSIRLKEKKCVSCGKMCYIFSRGRCRECSLIESVAIAEEKQSWSDFGALMDELDDVFSKYIRLKNADENGMCQCFTCSKVDRWQQLQCGHFISRKHMYTRWEELNAVVQCPNCNECLNGNMVIYRQKLEILHPGLPLILEEQGRIIHKWTRQEMKTMLTNFRSKIKHLQ